MIVFSCLILALIALIILAPFLWAIMAVIPSSNPTQVEIVGKHCSPNFKAFASCKAAGIYSGLDMSPGDWSR